MNNTLKPLVSVIIPNYNGLKFLPDCMEALRHQTYKGFEVIFVDNASKDESVEYIRTHYPEVKLLLMKENTGFSGGVNAGILASKAPFVILLNNDTKADPDFVRRLLYAITRSPKIFSVSSLMEKMYEPGVVDDAGDLMSLLGWQAQRGVGQKVADYEKKVTTVFSACAGAAIYRRKPLVKLGLFDRMHFAYLEDIDVGYRARLAGYDNIVYPKAKVLHVGSGTTGSQYNPFKVRLAARNSIYVQVKNSPNWLLILHAPGLLCGYLIKTLFFWKKGFVKDYLSGLWEGVKTVGECRRVPFERGMLPRLLKVEGELFKGTVVYFVEYAKRHLSNGGKIH